MYSLVYMAFWPPGSNFKLTSFLKSNTQRTNSSCSIVGKKIENESLSSIDFIHRTILLMTITTCYLNTILNVAVAISIWWWVINLYCTTHLSTSWWLRNRVFINVCDWWKRNIETQREMRCRGIRGEIENQQTPLMTFYLGDKFLFATSFMRLNLFIRY